MQIIGRVVEIGDDEDGQPRIVIYTTEEELRKAAGSTLYKAALITIEPVDDVERVKPEAGERK